MPDQILVATESIYGTAPSTGYRKFRPTGDNHKTRLLAYEHRGIGDGSLAPAEQVRTVEDGADGELEMPVASNGMGMLFRACASSATSTLITDATAAYEQVFTFGSGAAPTATTLTTEVSREGRSGVADVWRYRGGKPTQADLTQDKDGYLVLKLAIDYLHAGRLSSDPVRTPVDPAVAFRFLWSDAKITTRHAGSVDSPVGRCFESFSLTAPLALKVDDTCLNRDVRRHEPTRSGVFKPTGQAEMTYDEPAFYDDFVLGRHLEVMASWIGPTPIEGDIYPEFILNLGAIRFTGEDPQATIDERPKHALPFECRSLAGAAPVTMRLVTSDTGF